MVEWSSFVMAVLSSGFVVLLWCAVIVGTTLSLYLLLLALAGFRKFSKPSGQQPPTTRFAVLVPAHEEEAVIGRLLASLNRLDYPREYFQVHVVADHCTDDTAQIARSLGAIVHEHNDPEPRGKGRSLHWLVQRILKGKCGGSVDAFVVLDADSTVSRRFLRAMDEQVRAGHALAQGLVQIDNPRSDRMGQLRALAYEFISHVRPLGRRALGLSAGLRGNGMCLSRDCAARFAWDPDSLTEDYELHARLLAAGLRVAFAPGAVVHTQLPTSLAAARTQSERWERGRLDATRRHVPALLAHGLRHRSWASLDGAIELITPPFSIFIAVMLALFGLSLLTGSAPLIMAAAIGLAAQCLYTLRGIVLASKRYPGIYRALFFVPVFVLWKLGLYASVLRRKGRVQWTRTQRTPTRSTAMSRVCIIRHYYYPEDPRGRREAEALADAGHHVDILTLRNEGEPTHEVINGVHVRRLPVKHYRGSLFQYAYEYGAFFLLSFLIVTARYIRQRYDVVQVNSLPDFLVFAAAGCKLLGARVVLDMHECTPELFCTKYRVSPRHPIVRVLGWIEQLSLGFADQVITCTPQQRSVFASRGTPAEKITVVLNAANSAVFQPRSQEPVLWKRGGPFELVSHGLVVERYGLDTMVKAVALLAGDIPGIVLNVYGKGDYVPEMQALAKKLGVADRVIVHGFVPEEVLLEGIASAHVGVIAAKRDDFRELTHTQKMYEYVAMRKPVVIAETSAVRTHFDESCFQFFASDDAEDLARALLDLYRSPLRALAMVESSSRRYRTYSWDAQRHVYCNAVFGVAPRPAGVRVPERAVHVPTAELVPVAVEAIPSRGPLDLGGAVTPLEESGIYMSEMVEMAMPTEDGSI